MLCDGNHVMGIKVAPTVNMLKIPNSLWFYLFAAIMCIIGWIYRDANIEHKTYIYLLSMVAFSSAIANQYLAIPMVAICILGGSKLYLIYNVLLGAYLVMSADGLNFRITLLDSISTDKFYFIACLICFIIICIDIYRDKVIKN